MEIFQSLGLNGKEGSKAKVSLNEDDIIQKMIIVFFGKFIYLRLTFEYQILKRY